MRDMKLPQYVREFNRGSQASGLADDVHAFEENALTLIDGYVNFLPSLEAHMATLDQKDSDSLVNFNDDVAGILYGPRVLSLFKEDNKQEITRLAEATKQHLLAPKKALLDTIDYDNLALILIRPEARFLSEEIKTFLLEQKYEILMEDTLQVSAQQYWAMYNEGFLKSDIYDFPTRTLTYTRGESKVYIIKKDTPNLQHYLNAHIKGKSGIASKDPTLRGTVVYQGYQGAKEQNRELFYETVDPLGMYRAIGRGALYSKDPFYETSDPVLYYAGQGVHLPEDYELRDTLGVLLTNGKLKELQNHE